MVEKEKRTHTRVNSVNLLNYIYFDEDLKEESQGMGRTLNISETGLLLETNWPFKVEREVSLNISLEEQILSINGSVIYTNKDESGLSKSGIRFNNISDDELNVLKSHIQSSQI
jgi:c-di-GMP-binding flagellar brake protein YcgR